MKRYIAKHNSARSYWTGARDTGWWSFEQRNAKQFTSKKALKKELCRIMTHGMRDIDIFVLVPKGRKETIKELLLEAISNFNHFQAEFERDDNDEDMHAADAWDTVVRFLQGKLAT